MLTKEQIAFICAAATNKNTDGILLWIVCIRATDKWGATSTFASSNDGTDFRRPRSPACFDTDIELLVNSTRTSSEPT